MSDKKKIALIGAGNIGNVLATLSIIKELGDVVLIDLDNNKTQGKALDIAQSTSISYSNCDIIGSNNYEDIKDADVVIVTAGFARKPGMSRSDLLSKNSSIIKEIAIKIKNFAPNSFVIVITNPLDAMVQVMQRFTNFSPNKVVGMAGVLDSARFKYFLSQELNISIEDIHSFVLGGHGDAMVPLVRYTTISGIPLLDFIKFGWITQEKIDEICQRTTNGGAEIVKLLETGSAFVAPAHSAIEMAEAYLKDKRKILPCATYLNGEYGVKDLYVGVPAIIGAKGVEKVIEISLNTEEKAMLDLSIKSVKQLVADLDI